MDFRSVRGLVERMLVEHPDAGVIVIADKGSRTGDVVRVMDQCRLADAKSVSLARPPRRGSREPSLDLACSSPRCSTRGC